jgi:5-methylcytosine-specific restriction protein A
MDKLLFLNIGWMERYQGLESDTIAGEGAFVNKYNDPHDPETYPPCEIYNFQPYEGVMYGFVRIARGSIRIERLGASPETTPSTVSSSSGSPNHPLMEL